MSKQAQLWVSLTNRRVTSSPTNPHLADAVRLTEMSLHGDADLSIWTQAADGWGGSLLGWAEAVKRERGSGWLRSAIDPEEVKSNPPLESLSAILDRCGVDWCEPKSTAAKEGLDEGDYGSDGYYDEEGYYHSYEDDGATKGVRMTASVRRGGADWRAYFGDHPELDCEPWNLWLPPGEAEAPLMEVLQLRADGNFYLWAARTHKAMYLVAFATS